MAELVAGVAGTKWLVEMGWAEDRSAEFDAIERDKGALLR
jgi:hypothetical protein